MLMKTQYKKNNKVLMFKSVLLLIFGLCVYLSCYILCKAVEKLWDTQIPEIIGYNGYIIL